jgi:Sulfotransferase domain
MKPNYLVIGAAKCATTTIRVLLGRHPDIFMVRSEPQFFNDDWVFKRGFAWYESLFNEAGERPWRGEGSNAYTMHEKFPQAFGRITAYLPTAKLIYVVREPFSRIQSFWQELRSQHPDYAHPDFNRAVFLNRGDLTDASNYLKQLAPYRKHYGDESIHVVFYEDFRREPAKVLKGCFEFLGVDPNVEVAAGTTRLNESEGKTVADPFLSHLRSIGPYRRAVDRLPFSLRDRVARTFFYHKLRQRPQWQPETRAWVSHLLRDDLREFLVEYGKPADFWNLDAAIPEERPRVAATPEQVTA